MPEEDNDNTATDAPEADADTATEDVKDEQDSTDDDEGDEGDDETVPAPKLRKELTRARKDAANYRTKYQDAANKLKDAKTLEEFQAVSKELSDTNEKLLASERENVALTFKLPASLAKRLQGATREELEADAKELAKTVRPDVDDRDLGGGLDPANGTKGSDIQEAIDATWRRRHVL